ncbi:MAG TPA: DEAD/DEAH box helicase [Hanamia sp.]|nr:DEAD/DEAH box helicase [Hanamia sp.]
MIYTPRPYQHEAINAGVDFFHDKKKKFNAFEILPTGSGKSLVIANTVRQLEGKTVVFQPSKEILKQNFEKFLSYGGRAGIYSHSGGGKFVDQITYATIGSVAKKHHLFKDVKNVIIDECHLVNSEAGMYQSFINSLDNAKVLGLTATPYRLTSDSEGAQLKFLNRTDPRIFNKVIYHIQNDVLFDAGHLSKLEYFSFGVIDRERLETNSKGTDFSDASLRSYYRQINMEGITIGYANRLLAKRKNLLVFSSLISEAKKVAKGIPGAVVLTGDTPPELRDKILSQFKAGVIRCVVNVGVLTTGFDFPELETILISKSTMSLAWYYQVVGRVMRPHLLKESGWVVDLGGNINLFGRIETMQIRVSKTGKYSIWNKGRQLTDVPFSKN